MDTRKGKGAPKARLRAGGSLSLKVAGLAGVPTAGVEAVVLNVTAVSPTRNGFLTLWPNGDRRPTASDVNYTSGQNVAKEVVAKVGRDGRVNLYSMAETDVVVDVSGWWAKGSQYRGLSPQRLVDTRTGHGAPAHQVRGGTSLDVQVKGRGGVPHNAVAAVVNVTAVSPERAGFVSAFAAGSPRPKTSTVNFPAGRTTPGLAVVPLGRNGKVSLFTLNNVHLVVDVSGYLTAGGQFVSINPKRALDTRNTGTKPGARSTVTVPVAGHAGIPRNVDTVTVNLTVANSDAPGFVTAYPSRTNRPLASVINFRRNDLVSNSVTVKVGTDGKVALYTMTGTHLIADITGYTTKR